MASVRIARVMLFDTMSVVLSVRIAQVTFFYTMSLYAVRKILWRVFESLK